MWRILVFIAVASALAMGAVWLAERPGEVSIVWGGLTIETTVAIAAIGVVVLIVLGMMLWTLVHFMLGLPTAFSFASRARKRARGFEAVSRGMVAIGAGDPAAARRHAADASKLIGTEPLSLLLSAQSAQLSGDKPAAEAAFKQMLDEPATRVLGLRGLFVEARRRGDQLAARAFADEAVRLSPSLAWANDALLEHHSNAGEWDKARIAVERRAALRLADKTESRRHRAVLLAAEAQTRDGHDDAGALSAVLDAVKLAPGLVPAAAMAGRLLGARGDLRKAARILEAAWREQPQPDLAQVYLHLRHGDRALDRLARAETLMKLKPLDPESAFAVAEAAIEARDFARARAALSPLVAAIPTVKTCLLMARIEDSEHGASGRGREWLTRSVRAPRDNAWVADGVVSERWLPVSPISGRLDAFVWTMPPAILGGAGSVLEDWIEPVPNEASPAALEAPLAPNAQGSFAPVQTAGPVSSGAMTPESEGSAAPDAGAPMARAETLPEATQLSSGAAGKAEADPPAVQPVAQAEPLPAHGGPPVDHAAAPAGTQTPVISAAAEPPKNGPDFRRPPDDPGTDPDAPPPRKRTFLSFLSR